MNEEWWDRPVCWICDYWWMLLGLLLLGVAAFLTRDRWLPSTEPQLGTGDIQVTLRWQGFNDLDLHIIDPNGERIHFRSPASSSGGQLDVDSNAGCDDNMTENPIENIFWPQESAPSGTYRIEVNYFKQCDTSAMIPFEVRLLVDGREETFTGQIQNEDETIALTSFTR